MAHILDRPIWSALTTRHAALAEGGALARRYPASIVPFAASRDDSPESLRALQELIGADDRCYQLQAGDVDLGPALNVILTAPAVQMVATTTLTRVSDERIERLDQGDAADMLALATLTKPGPFSMRALDLGEFWGVRIDGALAAMAGERLRQEGHTELSGVCTHPDFRGRGLGRLMSLFVAGRIVERGELPYLHAYAANTQAIALYESLGFRLRTRMTVTLIGGV